MVVFRHCCVVDVERGFPGFFAGDNSGKMKKYRLSKMGRIVWLLSRRARHSVAPLHSAFLSHHSQRIFCISSPKT